MKPSFVIILCALTGILGFLIGYSQRSIPDMPGSQTPATMQERQAGKAPAEEPGRAASAVAEPSQRADQTAKKQEAPKAKQRPPVFTPPAGFFGPSGGYKAPNAPVSEAEEKK